LFLDFATPEDEMALLKEMQLMKQLGQHPCIVSMLGCCKTPSSVCIVMDYCSKGDLRGYLRKLRGGPDSDEATTSETKGVLHIVLNRNVESGEYA